MIKNLILPALLSSAFIFSCGENQKTQTSGNVSIDTSEKVRTPSQTQIKTNPPSETSQLSEENKKSETSSQNHDLNSTKETEGIRIKFPAGSTQVTLNGSISGFGHNITYIFEASKGQTLNASVKPAQKNGNIRIAQIFLPSGKADGPFGEQMKYSLAENGDYKLVLSENQMAGDPWKGEFFLTIEIK